MPERRSLDIKCHEQMCRRLFFDHFDENIQKTINGVRMESFLICQVRHPVKRPVYNTVSVDQYKFIHN